MSPKNVPLNHQCTAVIIGLSTHAPRCTLRATWDFHLRSSCVALHWCCNIRFRPSRRGMSQISLAMRIIAAIGGGPLPTDTPQDLFFEQLLLNRRGPQKCGVQLTMAGTGTSTDTAPGGESLLFYGAARSQFYWRRFKRCDYTSCPVSSRLPSN